MKIKLNGTPISFYGNEKTAIANFSLADFMRTKIKEGLYIELCEELERRGLIKVENCVEKDIDERELKYLGLQLTYSDKKGKSRLEEKPINIANCNMATYNYILKRYSLLKSSPWQRLIFLFKGI